MIIQQSLKSVLLYQGGIHLSTILGMIDRRVSCFAGRKTLLYPVSLRIKTTLCHTPKPSVQLESFNDNSFSALLHLTIPFPITPTTGQATDTWSIKNQIGKRTPCSDSIRLLFSTTQTHPTNRSEHHRKSGVRKWCSALWCAKEDNRLQ